MAARALGFRGEVIRASGAIARGRCSGVRMARLHIRGPVSSLLRLRSRLRSRPLIRRRIPSQPLSALVMPFLDRGVGFLGQAGGREVGREAVACLWVQDVEVVDGALEEGNVPAGVEEDLDGLPAHEAAGCEGGDGGGVEVVFAGLEGVLAAYGLVDE